MSAEPRWATQEGFGVRLCWGVAGLRALAPEVEAVVLVDVLRFTTALSVAVATGAVVQPAPWPFDPAGVAPGTEVADGSGPRRLSLSPGSLSRLRRGERIVLPSANGSNLSTLAASVCAAVAGGCLRNATAVERWLDETAGGGDVAVVPCGETWPGGGLRPAVEDLLGAGAIVSGLAAERSCSPEAAAAMAAFVAARPELAAAVQESVSGRELRTKGLVDDVVCAAELDVSDCVPVLGADGTFAAAAPRS